MYANQCTRMYKGEKVFMSEQDVNGAQRIYPDSSLKSFWKTKPSYKRMCGY